MIENQELKAKVHSFESFGAVDGPGIRFVIFMQGCPLRCKYCQNRDTWDMSRGEEYTVEQLVNKTLRSKPFMEASGGGITVSGGEPLLQSKFLKNLFTKLKEHKIHTAIDTSGCIKIDNTIKELLNVTDLVILDLKHIDEEKCIELTGVSNKKELEFAEYCSNNNIKLWIRQVLVPGYTDNESDLLKTREFIETLKTVEKIEILPYHNLGKFKWENLGLEYPFENVPLPTEDDIEDAKKILIKDMKKY